MASTDFDPKIVKPIFEGIVKAFSVQLSTQVEIVSLKPISIADQLQVDIAAMISLLSSQFNGTFAISFPAKTFLGLVSRLLGETYDKITPENADAAGEILNIIYGVARPAINTAGNDFYPAIPSVVRGDQINISHPSAQLVGVILCRSDLGPFNLELSLKKIK